MSKQKWTIIAILIVAAILAVLVVIALDRGIENLGESIPNNDHTQQGETIPNNDNTQQGESTPDNNVRQMEVALNAILDALDDNTIGQPAFLTKVDELNGFEVISYEETETGFTATVRVYAPDLYSIAKNIDENNSFETAEEALNAINEALKDAEPVERQLNLEFVRTEDGYMPILTSEFLDALYGGVFRLYDDLLRIE